MPDTAEILAQPNIAQAIRELVFRAMSDTGIAEAHCIRAARGLTDRIATGEPVAEAVALVELVKSALGPSLDAQQTSNVVEWLDGPAHDGPRSDGAIVKITDAIGRVIASVNARLLKDLVGYDALPDDRAAEDVPLIDDRPHYPGEPAYTPPTKA